MSLREESKENGKSERIEKYIESDESIKENMIFVIKLQKLLLLFLLNKMILFFFYLILNLLMLEFHLIIIKLLKVELFKFMQKFYMKLEKNLQI